MGRTVPGGLMLLQSLVSSRACGYCLSSFACSQGLARRRSGRSNLSRGDITLREQSAPSLLSRVSPKFSCGCASTLDMGGRSLLRRRRRSARPCVNACYYYATARRRLSVASPSRDSFDISVPPRIGSISHCWNYAIRMWIEIGAGLTMNFRQGDGAVTAFAGSCEAWAGCPRFADYSAAASRGPRGCESSCTSKEANEAGRSFSTSQLSEDDRERGHWPRSPPHIPGCDGSRRRPEPSRRRTEPSFPLCSTTPPRSISMTIQELLRNTAARTHIAVRRRLNADHRRSSEA